jgi:hypothetical protein
MMSKKRWNKQMAAICHTLSQMRDEPSKVRSSNAKAVEAAALHNLALAILYYDQVATHHSISLMGAKTKAKYVNVLS